MTRKRAVVTYLVLSLVLISITIPYTRSGVENLAQQTIDTTVEVIKSFGMIIGLNIFVGFLIKWPSSVVLCIPISTVFMLVAHQQLGDWFGPVALNDIGRMDAFLMYLPAVGLASLLGMLFGGKNIRS
ncbi:MAG: hypothetical protein COB39_03835 [Marinosulfonomonas sp.]|nr:MAG: hypothetical protein COB39_03835 [Marinosulfonomonas sp.]